MSPNNGNDDTAVASKVSDASLETESSTKPRRKRRIQALIPPNNNLGQDELLVKAFVDLVQQKQDSGSFGGVSASKDLSGVQDVLRPGFYWGCLATTTTFTILRKAPLWYMNRALSTRTSILHGVQGNAHYHVARRQKNPLLPRVSTHRDGSTTFHEGLLSASFTTVLDLSLSLLGGGLVWYYMVDKKKLFHAVSDIPLRGGESVVSEVLCEDFIAKDKEIPKRLWKEHTDDGVVNLRRFIDNCQRRHQFAETIRLEQGIAATEPVTIPPLGVPPDLVLRKEDTKQERSYDWTGDVDYWGDDDSDWEDEEEDSFWDSGT